MYFGGKSLILSAKNKKMAVVWMITALMLYSLVMIYLDRHGKLKPLAEYFEKKGIVVLKD